MAEKSLENGGEINKYEAQGFLLRELVEEIKRIQTRLENRYTKREEKIELHRVLAKNLATLQRALEEL